MLSLAKFEFAEYRLLRENTRGFREDAHGHDLHGEWQTGFNRCTT
jgi:hypothetical protein